MPRKAVRGCCGSSVQPGTASPHLQQPSLSPLTRVPSPPRKGGSGPQRSLSVEDIGAPGQLRAVGRVVEVFPDGTSQLELQRPPHGAFGFSVTSGHGRPDTGIVGSCQTSATPWSLRGGSCPTPGASLAMGGGGCSIAAEVQRDDESRGTLPHVALATHNPTCPSALGLGHRAHSRGCSSEFVSVQPLGTLGAGRALTHPCPSAGVYVQEMADAGTAKLYAGLLGVGDEILQVNGAAVSGLGLARIHELLLRADTLTLRVLRHRPAPR